MATSKDDDCVSKQPWSEVINRTLKKAFFNFFGEGAKSLGRWLIVLVVIAIAWFLVLPWIGSFFNWGIGSWIGSTWDLLPDWVPGADDASATPAEDTGGMLDGLFGADEPEEVPEAAPAEVIDDGPGVICRNTPSWWPGCGE